MIKCPVNNFSDDHLFTPWWIEDRRKPRFDYRVCMCCRDFEVRNHVDGTGKFPEWKYETDRKGIIRSTG